MEPLEFEDAAGRLKLHIYHILDRLETVSGNTIEKFKVGKSNAKEWKGRKFDPQDIKTWKKKDIISRWNSYKADEGYDGLVVIAAVTRRLVPEVTQAMQVETKEKVREKLNQELYTFMLEEELISHFMMKADARLANTTLKQGSKAKTTKAGVLYVAFKYSTDMAIPEGIDFHLISAENKTFAEALEALKEAVIKELQPPNRTVTECSILLHSVDKLGKTTFNHMDHKTWDLGKLEPELKARSKKHDTSKSHLVMLTAIPYEIILRNLLPINPHLFGHVLQQALQRYFVLTSKDPLFKKWPFHDITLKSDMQSASLLYLAYRFNQNTEE